MFYSVANKHHLRGIQTLVHRALRIAYRRKGIDSRTALHRKARLNSLKDRRQMHVLKLSFEKSLHDENLVLARLRTRRHDQRLLIQPRAKNPIYANSLYYRLASSWNNLHVDVRAIEVKSGFTRWIRTHYDELIDAYNDQTWI